MIAREMGKVEALLKVILSPADGLAEAFKSLLPVTANAVDYKAICELKGLKKPFPEPPYGLFSAVGAPSSTKPLADGASDAKHRPSTNASVSTKMDNVTSKMSNMFKQGAQNVNLGRK